MTRRRDRNRAARRALAEQFTDAYTCPDCNATKELIEHHPGVFVLAVAHDDTCPSYKSLAQQSPGQPEGGRR